LQCGLAQSIELPIGLFKPMTEGADQLAVEVLDDLVHQAERVNVFDFDRHGLWALPPKGQQHAAVPSHVDAAVNPSGNGRMFAQNLAEPAGNPIIQIWIMKDSVDVAQHMKVLFIEPQGDLAARHPCNPVILIHAELDAQCRQGFLWYRHGAHVLTRQLQQRLLVFRSPTVS
jgi:hypothetical protein